MAGGNFFGKNIYFFVREKKKNCHQLLLASQFFLMVRDSLYSVGQKKNNHVFSTIFSIKKKKTAIFFGGMPFFVVG